MRSVLLLLFLNATFVSAHPWHWPFQKERMGKRMADGKRWTTRNADVNIAPSYCYDDAEANCAKYGRLYTWESAPKACEAMGMGWRLPSEADWRWLAQVYGGVSADSTDRGKAAYEALMAGGRSKFGALLGGGRAPDGTYGRLEAHGFYWTSTDSWPAGIGWAYNFGKGGPGLHRQDGMEKTRALSVRCVRD
jgi:uncharacterized protein (TIGR02145 family)